MRPTDPHNGSVNSGEYKQLTVVQLLPALNGGGVERGTLEIANALVSSGHRSLVISGGGQLVRQLEAGGSRHFCWSVGRKSLLTLRWVRQLRQLLNRESVDILHARSRMPAWVAYRAWRGMQQERRPRFITTIHGLYSVNPYSAVMTKGERVIAVSDHARDYVLANFPAIDPGRITVIRRGVAPVRDAMQQYPDRRWLDNWHREFPATRGRYLVTLPGRISRRKGVLDFIEIISQLHADGIPVHGLIVGDIPAGRSAVFSRECRNRIADAGLDQVITLTGYRSDLREIMAVSSAVVSLSLHPEAYGRTVSEALSLGCPVAGYDHGGVREQLLDYFPQGRVPAGNTAAMAGCLSRWYHSGPPPVAAQPPTLQKMGAATLDLYRTLAG